MAAKETRTKVDWNAPLSEEEQRLSEQLRREYQERQRAHIEGAQRLGALLNATVIGVCGHLAGNGAREYALFRDNQDNSHFVVLGKDERGNFRRQPVDLTKRSGTLLVRSVEEWLKQ